MKDEFDHHKKRMCGLLKHSQFVYRALCIPITKNW